MLYKSWAEAGSEKVGSISDRETGKEALPRRWRDPQHTSKHQVSFGEYKMRPPAKGPTGSNIRLTKMLLEKGREDAEGTPVSQEAQHDVAEEGIDVADEDNDPPSPIHPLLCLGKDVLEEDVCRGMSKVQNLSQVPGPQPLHIDDEAKAIEALLLLLEQNDECQAEEGCGEPLVFGGEVWWPKPLSEYEMRVQAEKAEKKAPKRSLREELERRDREREEPELLRIGPDDAPHWMTAKQFRRRWDSLWSAQCGSFEDDSKIPAMRFTNKPPPDYIAYPMDTLQIFSVKLAATRGGLQLPIDVFGMVVVRDPIDHNRNIIFQRTRDDCQTITKEEPYLPLAGPARALMFIVSNPVTIEVDLKVRGTTESEDEYLSFFVAPVVCYNTLFSHLLNYVYTSKLSTFNFTLGHLISSVEATIFVKVTYGLWPDNLRGLFIAFTTGIGDKYTTGISHERIVLLDSRDEKLPLADGDGKIKLSRHVVSAESCGKVSVHIKGLEGDIEVVETRSSFNSNFSGKSMDELDFGFCKMEVTVFWSLISDYPLGSPELKEVGMI